MPNCGTGAKLVKELLLGHARQPAWAWSGTGHEQSCRTHRWHGVGASETVGIAAVPRTASSCQNRKSRLILSEVPGIADLMARVIEYALIGSGWAQGGGGWPRDNDLSMGVHCGSLVGTRASSKGADRTPPLRCKWVSSAC